LIEHDLSGKPVSTFPDHALEHDLPALSQRGPQAMALKNSAALVWFQMWDRISEQARLVAPHHVRCFVTP
jgi:hypothetical protein